MRICNWIKMVEDLDPHRMYFLSEIVALVNQKPGTVKKKLRRHIQTRVARKPNGRFEAVYTGTELARAAKATPGKDKG